ncbi:Arc family DNA-binding protein [Massilia sp. CT11-108]|uniref:Arc family DNA-binding protein n=1 Tax=Massilia sp. CT11-108 TaxID=3393900 RepID=UPI0039A4A73A
MLSSIKCLAIIRVYLTLRVKKTLCVVSRRLLCCCVMATQPIPYPLRMPEELRAQLEARAAARKRSLNAEILDILQSSVEGNTTTDMDLDVLAEEVARRVAAKLKNSER